MLFFCWSLELVRYRFEEVTFRCIKLGEASFLSSPRELNGWCFLFSWLPFQAWVIPDSTTTGKRVIQIMYGRCFRQVNLSGCQSISQGYSHLSLITWKYGSRCWFLVVYPWQISLFSKKCSLDMMYLYTLAYMHIHSIYIHNILYDTLYTPRKINMEPENRPLEKENHLPNHHFQVPC